MVEPSREAFKEVMIEVIAKELRRQEIGVDIDIPAITEVVLEISYDEVVARTRPNQAGNSGGEGVAAG